jgi:hypothetical protein
MRSVVAWVLIGVAVVLGGCGDDSRAEGPVAPVETGPIECEALTLPEAAHQEEIRIVTELPEGGGGALRDGDYELVAHVRYRMMASSDDDPTFMRAALRLRRNGTVMDYVYDEGTANETPTPRGFTARVTRSGGELVLEHLCPEDRTTAIGYTASGSSLSLIEHDEEMRFERR